jgi:hypothetical protein
VGKDKFIREAARSRLRHVSRNEFDLLFRRLSEGLERLEYLKCGTEALSKFPVKRTSKKHWHII